MNDLIDNNAKENIESTISKQQNESLEITDIPPHDGTWAEDQLYNQVLQLIRDIEPALEPEQRYTAEMLCGKAFWNPLENGDPIRAGKYIAHAVACGDLPFLCFAGKTSKNHSLYKLK